MWDPVTVFRLKGRLNTSGSWVGILPRAFQAGEKKLNRLCARNGIFFVEDKKGHTTTAQCLRAPSVGLNCSDKSITFQHLARFVGIQANFNGQIYQYVPVTDDQSIGEV